MALSVGRIKSENQIYSPFSGLPAHGEDGPNEEDPTLLFVYYGDAGLYGYVSEHLQSIIGNDVEETLVEDMHSVVSDDGGFILEVDAGWNGVNTYGFKPVD